MSRSKKKNDDQVTLKDSLNESILEQLKKTKKDLENKEQKEKEEEMKRRAEEKRLREKNKSFEELFNESNMKWEDYKK